MNVLKSRLRNQSDVLTQEEKDVLKSVCGQLLWVSNNTRPDVAFEISTLSNGGKNTTVNDIVRINKLIKNLKHERVVVKYPN